MKNILRLITGTKRSGKTFLARRFLDSRKPARRCALDPTAEDYPQLPIWSRVEMAQALALAQHEGEFSGRLIPEDVDDFVFFCRAVSAADDLIYCVDEAGLVINPHQKERAVYALATLGGHWKQDGIWITQQPTTVPTVLRSQVDEIYFFRMDEKNDLEWCENYLGEHVEELPRLGVRENAECFVYRRGEMEIERIRLTPQALRAMIPGSKQAGGV